LKSPTIHALRKHCKVFLSVEAMSDGSVIELEAIHDRKGAAAQDPIWQIGIHLTCSARDAPKAAWMPRTPLWYRQQGGWALTWLRCGAAASRGGVPHGAREVTVGQVSSAFRY
jgi:hypothetical protein